MRKSKVAAAIWKKQTTGANCFIGSDSFSLSKLAVQAHSKTGELVKADGKAGESAVPECAFAIVCLSHPELATTAPGAPEVSWR